MNTNTMSKTMVIVAGASRGIGKAFLEEYRKRGAAKIIGINRTGSAGHALDLMDSTATYEFVKQIDMNSIDRIVYMHAVGIDKFEPQGKPHIDFDGDGIDDEVMASNYSAFIHLAVPLVAKTKMQNIHLTICNIGSISDAFNVPYWQSFTRAKNLVRKYCKSLSEQNISSIFLNVGSTLDEQGNTYGRKNINTAYWQTADELVKKSFDILDGFHKTRATYAEFDFFKYNPTFRQDYFTNLQELYTQWQRDLGYAGKEVPLGIRI